MSWDEPQIALMVVPLGALAVDMCPREREREFKFCRRGMGSTLNASGQRMTTLWRPAQHVEL